MKAWVLHGAGDLRFTDVNKPTLTEGEVLVNVKAAGICGSDIPRIYQTGAHRHPLIPGHEFSGVVAEVDSKTDADLVGQKVGVFPLLPCGKCLPCMRKQYELCRNYSYIGSRRDGAFAEYVAVPKRNLLFLPESVSFEEAAMLEPMAVAVHAMRQGMPMETDTVVVCGLGTIGMLLLMFLQEAGVKHLLAIGNKEFQKQSVLKLGLPQESYCDSRVQNAAAWIAERTNNSGTDVFFECVGKNETLLQSVDAAAPSGRIVLVGNPYTDMTLPKDLYWKVLRNQLTVKGIWNSSFTGEESDDWHYVRKRLVQKKIAPAELISHKFSLENIEEGLHIMRDKREDYLKVIILPN